MNVGCHSSKFNTIQAISDTCFEFVTVLTLALISLNPKI